MKKNIIVLLSALLLTSCGATATSNEPVSVPSVSPSANEEVSSNSAKVREITERPTEDGYFEFLDADGTEYIGEFKNGLYDGQGTINYTDGCSYTGTFSEGVRNGTGTLYWNTGCIYIGEMKDDLMHGRGYMKWPMGDYYYGQWKYGNINGVGTKYFLIDAYGETTSECYNIYFGEFVDGLMEGHGVMTYTFGATYDGEWEEGIRHGYGTYIWEETDDPSIPWLMYKGNFIDWISGEGTLYFKDGSILTGDFDGNALPLTAE